MWDALWRNGKVATMTAGASAPFGLIDDGVVAAEDGRIAWIGAASALPGAPATCARAVHDLGGRLLTPGLVDPHNHAVYDGDALGDFELLTQGGTRGDMIAAGGGVGGLVRQTRAASDGQIYAASAARVAKLIASGMTTLESKSGAGLDLAIEREVDYSSAQRISRSNDSHRARLLARGGAAGARRVHRAPPPGVRAGLPRGGHGRYANHLSPDPAQRAGSHHRHRVDHGGDRHPHRVGPGPPGPRRRQRDERGLDDRRRARDAPHRVVLTAVPGIAILATVLALNLVGEGLNDALNPNLRDQ